MGRALEHACVQIISVTRTLGEEFKNSKYNSKAENQMEAQFIGQRIKFKQEKSKVGGIKGAVASINYYYDPGLDVLQNMIDMGKMYNIIDGTTWLSLVDPITGEVVAKAQGGLKFKQALAESEDLYKKFEYLLSYTTRGLEIKSIVTDWNDIHMELFGTPAPTEEPVEQTTEDTDED